MLPPDCPVVDTRDVLATEGPSVLVLGIHPSDPGEVARVYRAIRHLRGKGPVRVALEVVAADQGTSLWSLKSVRPDLDVVPEKVGWTWRGAYAPWRPLFALGLTEVPGSVELVAAGPPPAKPASSAEPDAPVPSPEAERLAGLTSNLPTSWRVPMAQDRAWTDAWIARHALDGWDQAGVLVVVVDHTRVAASSGVAWHLAESTTVPVRPVIVSAAAPDCPGGAQAWSPPPSTLRVALRKK